MLVAILVFILSQPGEPVILGILDEFKTPAECLKAVRDMNVPDEHRNKFACIEIKKQREA